MTFYSCRSIEGGYRMVKFDSLLFVESVYDMPEKKGIISCSCFQASKPTCRHRQMIENFIMTNRVDSGWFFHYEDQNWELPIVMPHWDIGHLVYPIKGIIEDTL